MLLKKEKETHVKFSPGFSANRPSNNCNLVPRAFPLKNGWGHFLREKPWGRGWNNWAQIFCGTPSLGAPACSLRSAVCSLQMSYTAKPGLTTEISHW